MVEGIEIHLRYTSDHSDKPRWFAIVWNCYTDSPMRDRYGDKMRSFLDTPEQAFNVLFDDIKEDEEWFTKELQESKDEVLGEYTSEI